MVPARASAILNGGPGRELLERQLASDAAHVDAALTQAPLGSPLSCLALVYSPQEELASVSLIHGWTEDARDAAFAGDPRAALRTLWSPADWDVDFDDVVEPPAPDARTHELTRMLVDAGCEDPAGALLIDLAHRLNRAPLPVATSSDFACWPTGHELDDEPWRWMAAVARPDAVERYAANGWLSLPEDDER